MINNKNRKKLHALVLIILIVVFTLPVNVFAYSSTKQLTDSNAFYRPLLPGDDGGVSFDPDLIDTELGYDPQWTSSDLSGDVSSDIYYYALFKLTPSVTAEYRIETTEASDLDDDTQLLLYSSFNEDDPTENIIAANEDIDFLGDNYLSKIEIELTQGVDYYLVLTSYWADTTGNVEFSISPDNIQFEVASAVEVDSSAPKQEIRAENPKLPIKIEPITLLNKISNTHTNDLSYLVAIPEQWMDTTSQVEFWLDSNPVTSKSKSAPASDYNYLDTARDLLKSIKSTLLSTYQVDLMQRVTKKDGTITEAKVAQEAIRGNFTIRLPIPANLLKTKNLGIVYIEEGTGLTANLASKIVTIDGVKYIEFQNNRAAVYGFVSDKNNAAVVQ